MVKTTPVIRAFNAGEFSALMEGRTDLDFYPASMRRSVNCIITPQGPIICRSGTRFVAPARTDEQSSTLLPFVYNTEQAKALEFCSDRIRFIDENGIQVYAAQAATVASTTPFKLAIPTLAALVGQQLVLDGFPASYNLNGEIVNIVAVVGTTYTLDRNVPSSVVTAGTASLVYSVAIDYTEAQRAELRVLQDVDILYLLCGTKQTKKLERYGDYDWRLSDVSYVDGPYMDINETSTTITPSSTGNALVTMTGNTAPSGTASGSGKRNGGTAVSAGATWLGRTYDLGLPATDYFHAFDDSDETYWASSEAQKGTLEITPVAGFACTGYTIYAPLANADVTYLNTDFAPSTWYFEGYDGAAWVTLDFQENYVAYDNDRTVFFELNNTVVYTKYRLRIINTVRNGQIEPRVRRLVLRSGESAEVTLTASSIVGINRDVGFLETDVGRLLRLRGNDNFWRAFRITEVVSATVVDAILVGTPLLGIAAGREWRMGLWSDTTGWPSTGDFYGDRMWLGPSTSQPNVLCGSVVGLYENFTHVEEDGVVLDDGAIVHYIKSRQLSRIKWIVANERGLIVGTGSQEFSIEKSVSGDINLTQRNIKSNPSTSRGSTSAEPVKVDSRILHVPRNGRTLRELVYSYESDGYVSNNMSRFASHLGAPGLAEQAYAAEPHTIDWIRRGDNSLVGLTYNRDEGVVGWHQQDFAGAEIESILVIPQQDQQQDALWMQTRRLVDGVYKRYIEYMTRPWDFGMTLDEAIFVDCAISYEGDDTTTLYGAQHLEGLEVYGLARNGEGTTESPYEYLPFGPIVVDGGKIELDFACNYAVVGLGYESNGEVSRLENGQAEGTAQGKVKRTNEAVILVWDSACGQVGTWDDQTKEFTFEDLEYPADYAVAAKVQLHTGMLDPKVLGPGYSMRGSIAFRRAKDTPLPFNVVAVMPKMVGYDGA